MLTWNAGTCCAYSVTNKVDDGHVWPGGLQDYLPRLLGPSTALADANLEMWRFFQRFTL